MLRIVDRYLLKEVVSGWLAVTVVLWLVLVSNKLVRFLGDAADGDIPGDLVFSLLGLQMAWYLILIVPFALALGTVLGLGRLYRDNEMVVLSACGASTARIYRPLLTLACVVALVLAWLALFVGPEVQGQSSRLKDVARQQADMSVLGEGRFNELHSGRFTFYAERLSDDGDSMENLFIVVRGRDADTSSSMISARTAYRTQDSDSGDDFLVLVDGYRYEGTPGAADYRVMQFDRYGVRVDLPGGSEVVNEREALPSAQLLASDDLQDIAELQWRIALPLSCIVLAFLAVPLCMTAPREGRYGRLVLAVLLFVIYYNLLGAARVWVGRGDIPVAVGLWWVVLLPLLLGFILLQRNRLACRLGLVK